MVAERGIDNPLLTNCCAGCSFRDSRRNPAPRWPRGRDGGERPACEAHTSLLEEEARHQHVCGWAQLLEDEDLSYPTSISGEQFRTDFRLPYVPFFLGAVDSQSIGSHSLTSNVSRKNTKTACSIRRTIKRVAIHNPVGKITDRKPAFSILVSDCIRSGYSKYTRYFVFQI